jgi:LysR family transcriptional regulator, nitrogen assimilation regulatory protein
MDVRQLRYFVGVINARSITKAAGLLHVAQPALGVQIRNLERELGAKLLHRHARGIEPTEAGERLAKHANSLLQEFDRLRHDLMDYATTPTGGVLICIGRSVPRVVAATIAQRCRISFPNIQLRILDGEKHSAEAIEQEVDVVLAFRPKSDMPAVSEALVLDELALIYSAQSARLPSEIDFRAVAERTLILPSKNRYTRRLVESVSQLSGHSIKLYCELDSVQSTIELVAKGAADTLLPIACVRNHLKDGKIRVARIKNRKLQRTLYMFQPVGQSRSSAKDLIQRELRSIILEFAKDCSFGWKEIAHSGLHPVSLVPA